MNPFREFLSPVLCPYLKILLDFMKKIVYNGIVTVEIAAYSFILTIFFRFVNNNFKKRN